MRPNVMMMLVSLVVAFAVACAPGEARASSPPPPLTVPTLGASPASTPVTLTGSRLVAAEWAYIGNVAVSQRWFAWSGVHAGDATRDPQELMLMDRSNGLVRAIARGPSPAGLFAWLRINDDWAVWAEYTDRGQISDWRLLAQRLPNGPTTTLLSAPSDAGIGDRPEFALSGDHIVVSARPAGATRMQFLRVSLATGDKRVLLSADPGETFGWPAFDGDVAAVESHKSAIDRVVVVSSVAAGQWSVLGSIAQPMSEPALAGRWLGFKAAGRSDNGPLMVRDLVSGGETILADSVEAPVGSGSMFVWAAGGGSNVIYGADKEIGSTIPLLGRERDARLLRA